MSSSSACCSYLSRMGRPRSRRATGNCRKKGERTAREAIPRRAETPSWTRACASTHASPSTPQREDGLSGRPTRSNTLFIAAARTDSPSPRHRSHSDNHYIRHNRANRTYGTICKIDAIHLVVKIATNGLASQPFFRKRITEQATSAGDLDVGAVAIKMIIAMATVLTVLFRNRYNVMAECQRERADLA